MEFAATITKYFEINLLARRILDKGRMYVHQNLPILIHIILIRNVSS